MKDLVIKGRTDLIKGFKKKSGTGTYDACLVVNSEFKVRMEFENSQQPSQSSIEAGKADISMSPVTGNVSMGRTATTPS
jgi:hypothetical protein